MNLFIFFLENLSKFSKIFLSRSEKIAYLFSSWAMKAVTVPESLISDVEEYLCVKKPLGIKVTAITQSAENIRYS